MQKFRFLLIALVLCMLLPSCTPTADMGYIPTDDDSIATDTQPQTQNGEYRDIIGTEHMKLSGSSMQGALWNNLVFTSKAMVIDLETGETFSACSDPLCDHRGEGCARRVLLGADALLPSYSSTQDDLVLYIGRSDLVSIVDDHTVTYNHRILRYHFYTGEVTVLAENLAGPNMLFSIDPATDNLFLNQSLVNDDGEHDLYLYIVNGKTGKVQILPTADMGLSAQYVIGDTVYCTHNKSGNSYCIDLSPKKPVVQETEMETVGVHDGYKYYAEKVGEQRIWVPDDVIPISEEHGKEPYRDFTKYDLYRVSILQEDASPELVAQGIAEYGVNDRYVYYLDFAPEYRGSHWVATDFTKQVPDIVSYYAFDDPSVPEGAALRNIFREDYGPVHNPL